MGHIKDPQKRKKYLSVTMTIGVMLLCFGLGVLVGVVI